MSANNAALNHLKQRRAKIEADEAEVERDKCTISRRRTSPTTV